MKLRHPYIIGFLMSIIISLLTMEGIFHFIDPWKAEQYFGDLTKLFNNSHYDPLRQYVQNEGAYQYSNWSTTINAKGERAIPDNHTAACTIAFVGDSVTFGYGVNDADTWVNLIAQKFPKVHFINTGLYGYNIEQVYYSILVTPANGYFYTLIDNDADPMIKWHPPVKLSTAYEWSTPTYIYLWLSRRYNATAAPKNYIMFDNFLTKIKSYVNLKIVGFPSELSTRAKVDTVPFWSSNNSFSDAHASPQGNQQIAQEMFPFVRNLIQQVCP